MTFAGELTILTSADLRGLGENEGSPVKFAWMMPSFAPKLLPWLALLALFALPSNRRPAAWLTWVPVAVLVGGAFAVERALAASDMFRFFGYYAEIVGAAGFGLAALWLAGAAQARWHAVLGFLLSAFCLAVVSLLRVISLPVWEELSGLNFISGLTLYVMGFCLATGFAFAGALMLSGLTCRRHYAGWKVLIFLPIGLGALWVLLAMGLWLVATLVFGESGEFWQFLAAGGMLALFCYIVSLPFLVLALVSAFHRRRLQDLLRLRGAPPDAAVPEPPLIAAQSAAPGADLSVAR